MSELGDFLRRVSAICARDGRYKQDGYLFVMSCLARAAGGLPKPRHITGRELLDAMREEAQDQFGPMAGTVLEHWGIKNSLDFGRIVFNMVDEGILSKTESDSLDDFKDVSLFENSRN
ncbi:MAG: hypothetical protein HYT89_05820 [Candidatus Omnitrophica bacterium]|nr:hypothetical protein [Candidatus Omnitrophota bacterium]